LIADSYAPLGGVPFIVNKTKDKEARTMKRIVTLLNSMMVLSLVLSACALPTPEAIEKEGVTEVVMPTATPRLPEYSFKLDYIKSTRYGRYTVEDDFRTLDQFDYFSVVPERPERPYYSILVGKIQSDNIDVSSGVLNLRSSDAEPVPWGTDYEIEIQQEFAVPSSVDEFDSLFEWNGEYQLIARFIGETIDDIIPKKMNGIDTYYDIVLARNDPFTAANGSVYASGIVFTKVFHNPNTDRDEVEEIASIDWESIQLDPSNPSLTLRLDLDRHGTVTASYSTDRETHWREIGKAVLPGSNFQGRIITGAFGNFASKEE
jgi:hypothetical protein